MESLHLQYSGSDENYPQIEFVNTGTGSNAGSIIFKKNSSDGPANDDKLGKIIFQGTDSTNNTLENFSEIVFSSTNVISGSEDAKIQFKTKNSGGASLQELLTLESNRVSLGGFLTPRLDVIFEEYAAAGAIGSATPNGVNDIKYFEFIQTMSSLEGVVSVPYAAETSINNDETSSYAINQPWGQTNSQYHQQSISFNSNNQPTPQPSTDGNGNKGALSDGYNFFHIDGDAHKGSGDLEITVLPAANNKKIVFVIRATLKTNGNDCVVAFKTAAGSEFDNNSVAIIANAPEIARKSSGDTKLKIIKDHTSNTAVKTKSRISGYIYFNPVEISGAFHYQVLGCLFATRPGDASAGIGNLVDDDHDSVRFVFST